MGDRSKIGATRLVRKRSLSAALTVLLAGAIAVCIDGCAALPALSAIPSVLSLAHDASTSRENDADKKNPDAELAANEPSRKPIPVNRCEMIAITRPNMVVVELRRGVEGGIEYRELHLLKSKSDAHWTPIVGGGAGPEGWRPAVNFLKMDFKPPLADAVPNHGTIYLAYAPTRIASNDPNQGKLESALKGATGVFSWDGRVYQYTVARTLPCSSPSSEGDTRE